MTIQYRPFESLFLRWRGTVLPRTWKTSLCTAALSGVLACVFNEHRLLVKGSGEHTLLWHLFDDAAKFFTILTTFVTFILGFFNATVYARWWKYRDLCGVVVGRTIDSAVMIASYVDPAHRDADSTKKDLLRLLWLAQALHLMDARGETELEPLLRRGLLKRGSEHTSMMQVSGCRPSVAYGWFICKLTECGSVGMIRPEEATPQVLQQLQINVTSMRGAGADVGMYLNTPIPLGYTHLLELIVGLYVFIAAPCGLVTSFLWLSPMVSAIVTTFFSGFLMLGRMMMDPFADDVADRFEVQDYLNGVIRASSLIIENVPLREQPGLDADLGIDGAKVSSSPAQRASRVSRRSRSTTADWH